MVFTAGAVMVWLCGPPSDHDVKKYVDLLNVCGDGALIEFASWRWIFGINVPFVLATLWLAQRVPESRDEEMEGRIDYVGAVLASFGLAGPVFALIEQPRPHGVA